MYARLEKTDNRMFFCFMLFFFVFFSQRAKLFECDARRAFILCTLCHVAAVNCIFTSEEKVAF